MKNSLIHLIFVILSLSITLEASNSVSELRSHWFHQSQSFIQGNDSQAETTDNLKHSTKAYYLALKNSSRASILSSTHWSHSNYEDLKTDFKNIIKRYEIYFKNLYNEAKSSVAGDWKEVGRFLWHFMDLLWLLLGWFGFLWIKKKAFSFNEKLQTFLTQKAYHSDHFRKLGMLHQKYSDYLVWGSIYLAIEAFLLSLSGEYARPARLLITILNIYIGFKLFKLISRATLFFLWDYLKVPRFQTREKVLATSRKLSQFFLIYGITKAVAKFLFFRGPIYLEISLWLDFLWFPTILFSTKDWKPLLINIVNQEDISFKSAIKLLNTRQGAFLSVVLWLLVLFRGLLAQIWEVLSDFESFKKISAKLISFKVESRKLEAESYKSPLSDEYKTQFRSFTNWVDFSPQFISSLDVAIDSWLAGLTKENSISLYAEKGFGKTTLLKKMQDSRADNSLFLSIPNKITAPEKLSELLSKELPYYSRPFPEVPEKKVIFLDNVHNLFIAEVGGFSAYKEFLNFINETKDLYFWVAAFNTQAWEYLESVLGKHQYFRVVESIPRWNEEMLKNLVLGCHGSTGYKCTFDEWISVLTNNKSTQTQFSDIEEKYFRLLWEKARGNPGVAKEIWLKSLSAIDETRVEAGPPAELDFADISSLLDDAHFAYAALVRHENLSVAEAALATNLPLPIIKQAFHRGAEENLLYSPSPGRYCLAPAWLYPVIKFLKGKNFLYGIN